MKSTFVNGIYRDAEHQRLVREATYLRLKAAQAQVEVELYLLETGHCAPAKSELELAKAQAKRMRAQGASYADIGKALGRSKQAVNKWFK